MMEDVPEIMRGIVEDHLKTHVMWVDTHANRILKLPNGKARLDAFNLLEDGIQEFVKRRVHEIRSGIVRGRDGSTEARKKNPSSSVKGG